MAARAVRSDRDRRPLRRRARRAGLATLLAAVVLAGVAWSPGASADEYDPQRAGHPVRLLAYVVHPVGVVLDFLLFRPAHWIVSLPGLDEFFGHERYED